MIEIKGKVLKECGEFNPEVTEKIIDLTLAEVRKEFKKWWQGSLMFQMDDIDLEDKGILMISEVELKQAREEFKNKIRGSENE